MREVTDPSLLAQLDAPQSREVTDPNILAQLEGVAPVMGGNGPEAPASGAAIPKSIGRQLGITGRVIANAVASPAVLGAKAAEKGINLLSKTLGQQRTAPVADLGQMLNEGLTAAGLPEYDGLALDVAKSAPAFALPGGVLPQAVGNAAISAIQAPEGQEGTQALVGGALGAGGSLLAKTMGIIRAGAKPTDAALELQSKGIPLTPGQLAPEGSWLRKGEEALSHAPMVGAPLRSRMREATTGYQQASRNLAAPGAATMEDVQKALSKGYDDVLGSAQFTRSPPIGSSIDLVRQAGMASGATNRQMNQAQSFVDDLLSTAGSGSNMTPRAAHWIESRLKAEGYASKLGNDRERQIYGQLLLDTANDFRQAWRGVLDAPTSSALKEMDDLYTNYAPIREASSKGVGTLVTPEAYTPKSVLQAARRKGNTSPQQELAAMAERAIGSNTPKATEMGWGTVAGLGGALGAMGNTPTALGLGAAGLGYGTKTGQKMARGLQRTLTNDELAAVLDVLRKGVPQGASHD